MTESLPDEVLAIRAADFLRAAAHDPAIRPALRLAFARAAEQLEAAIMDVQREEQAA